MPHVRLAEHGALFQLSDIQVHAKQLSKALWLWLWPKRTEIAHQQALPFYVALQLELIQELQPAAIGIIVNLDIAFAFL